MEITGRRPAWLRQHLRLLVAADALAALSATLLAHQWAFGTQLATIDRGTLQVPYITVVLVAVPAWLSVLAAAHGHDLGPFGRVEKEARKVVRAGAHFLALAAVIYYAVNVERVAREFFVAIVPLAVLLTIAGRKLARHRLSCRRREGHAQRRAIVVGPASSSAPVEERLLQHPLSCIVAADHTARTETPAEAIDLLEHSNADILLVTALAPGELRALTWRLEGTGVDVLVAPPPAQIPAQPYLEVRPVAGLPLLYVDR